MTHVWTQTIGYPRIGPDREVKRALEAYWKGALDREALLAAAQEVEAAGWQAQLAAGIDRVGVGDATLYDHVLDWAVRMGLVATRFRHLEGLERYFTMARGAPGVPALELTKWFDTNYHYLVPELDVDLAADAQLADFLASIRRAQEILGERAVPIVLGPVTLLRLARLQAPLGDVLQALLPRYRALQEELLALGVAEVQFHEPVLVLGDAPSLETHFRTAYEALGAAGPPINLVTYFDDLGETYPWVAALPVETLSLDFTRGHNLDLIQQNGWPEGKTLAAGVVDGRNIWRIRPDDVQAILQKLKNLAPLRIGPSSSLQFVPYRAARETHLPDPLRGVLAFAEEKLAELRLLAQVTEQGRPGPEFAEVDRAWASFQEFSPDDPKLAGRIRNLSEADYLRTRSYTERRALQVELPFLPTTTIGSFPQTREVRRLRGRFKRGEINLEEYQAGVDTWIAYTIGFQEGLGLDVLVHGEFERSDMVEYFAEKLTGFAFTTHGWVQSYGSRYVRPPIIFGDVRRPTPMTVREYQVAQSFTQKPVKGMLTGPVTILNWSYPRVDLSRQEVAFQIALSLREEIADLEAAGARVIQVDEPALREGLPLKPERWVDYLSWAVDAFRLTTTGAAPETQVHTHMCYAEFGDILEDIERLGADVISIENARSGDETLRELAGYGYGRAVGPGVYDVHSPIVPEIEQIQNKLRAFLRHLPPDQIWVNPDCGLKTRGWEEVQPSLEHIVKAVKALRVEIQPEAAEQEA